jgi:hypothetical protein
MNSMRFLLLQGPLRTFSRALTHPTSSTFAMTARSFSDNLDRLRGVVKDIEEGKKPEFVNKAKKTGAKVQKRPWNPDSGEDPVTPPQVEQPSEIDSTQNLNRLRGVVKDIEDGKSPEFVNKATKGGKGPQRTNVAASFSKDE